MYKPFSEGLPETNCLVKLKEIDEASSNMLFYETAALLGLQLLILMTICGICRSSDKRFGNKKEFKRAEEPVEALFTDLNSMRQLNN
jgi:hypothetical protein